MKNADDIKIVLEALIQIRNYYKDNQRSLDCIDGSILALNWILKGRS